ncbi:MAG: STAS/SEC14 domain-containing protein [Anderseniella sp.]|nr:STAS/SEC14 domain-containing protein [Anderseniella sp.]
MAIDYKIDTKDGVVTLHFSAPPTMEDYETSFPDALREIDAAQISRWLIVLDYEDPISDQRARSFNEFVALEINRYVSKIAIVCPVQWHARLNNIFEPLSNQGKLVGMFQTIEEAKSWIQNQNAQ